MLTKDQAICIRTVDYSETSQIVTLFTKAGGKIDAIAKGAKRPKSPFDGPLEVFSCGNIVFSQPREAKLATLTEFQQTPAFSQLSKNFFAMNCALLAAELINLMTTHSDPHPELFDDFLQFLKNINKQQPTSGVRRNTLPLLILFQLQLLSNVGLQPVLNACGNCKTKFQLSWPEAYFSSSSHSLLCKDCSDSFPDRLALTKKTATCLSNLKL
ncbi:MAG: DNA repair protein RecO, partial [Planctomycetota bacterium]